MSRIHLFEFGDQPWLPRFLRDAMTAYLSSVYAKTDLPAAWAARLAGPLSAAPAPEIVDLGSGSGGPMPFILAELHRSGLPATVTLTDLFPPALPASGELPYWPEPVDARSVPPRLAGLRTMIASFHHFPPEQARQILTGAARCRAPICIFEATSRTPAAIASSLFIPLLVLLLTPAIRPLRFSSLLFTYAIPVLPLIIFWDGLVSHLRTYSAAEMLAMANQIPSPDYLWSSGELRLPGIPAGLPYLIGQPQSPASADAPRR